VSTDNKGFHLRAEHSLHEGSSADARERTPPGFAFEDMSGGANPSTCSIESSDELIKTHRQCVQMPEARFTAFNRRSSGYNVAPDPAMDPSTTFYRWYSGATGVGGI